MREQVELELNEPFRITRIEWERCDNGSYAWPLGFHYYCEKDGDEWLPCRMEGNEDLDQWSGVPTREEAEQLMQDDFEKRLLPWIVLGKNQ